MIKLNKLELSKIRLLHETNSVVTNTNKKLIKEEVGCGGPLNFSLGGGWELDLQIEPNVSFDGVDWGGGSYGCTLTFTFAYAPVGPMGGAGESYSATEVMDKVIENGASVRDAMKLKKEIERKTSRRPRRR